MSFKKNKQKSDEEELTPRFILINRKKRKVWHEQFRTESEAQGKIDYERKYNGVDGGWEIDEV